MLKRVISRRRFLIISGGLAAATVIGCEEEAAPTATPTPTPTGTVEATPTPSGAPVKIGAVLDITGFFATFGDLMRKGTELGVEVVNEQGGILGRPVQLLVEDNQSSEPVSAERARKLFLQDEVEFVLGTVSSSESLAIVPVATEFKRPFFYILEGEDKTCAPGAPQETNPYVFGIGSTPEQFITPLVPVLIERYGTDWYLIGSDYVFPRSVNAKAKELLVQAGGRVVAEEYAPLGTTDFRALLDRIQAARPSLLLSNLVGPDAIAFSLQGTEGGQLSGIPVAGSAHFRPVQLEGLGQTAVGAIVAHHYTDAATEIPENVDFVQRFREKYNFTGPIDPVAADCYSTILIIKAAAEKAGTTEADAFIAAAEGLEVATPKGNVIVDPENHILQQHMYLQEVTAEGYKLLEDLGIQKHPDHAGCSVT